MTCRIRTIRLKPHVERLPGARRVWTLIEGGAKTHATFISIGHPHWRRQG